MTKNSGPKLVQAFQVTMKIEWPVMGIDTIFHETNWQPDQRYWNGRIVRGVPEPFQAT